MAWNTNCDINFTQFSTILVGSTKDYCYPTICLLKSVATLHQKRARGYACSIHKLCVINLDLLLSNKC